MTIWKHVARFAARPAVADWLIRRAMKTPFSHLPSNEDPSYMERYWLLNPYPISSSNRMYWQFRWSIRIHHIKRCDYDRDLHDHPWNARTIVLKGDYVETRLDKAANPTLMFWRQAGDTATLAFEEYHQINEVSEGGVWTLFITGPWRGVWGFLVDGVKVPWRTYLGEGETSSTGVMNYGGAVLPSVAVDSRPTKPIFMGNKVIDCRASRSNVGFIFGEPGIQPDEDMSNDPVIKDVAADALAIGTKLHHDLEKIRINTGMFPALRGIPAFEQKLILNKQFGNMSRFHPRVRPWTDCDMGEILKDIEALEAIYKRNPQLEAMVGGEFKIRSQDRDDDGLVDPSLFGTPDDHTDDFERLVNMAQDQRHPRTSREWALQHNINKEFGKMGWDGKAVDCEKLRIADQRCDKDALRVMPHPLDNIAEWRKGCSCAPNDPADCNECTTALINAIEAWFHQHGGPRK